MWLVNELLTTTTFPRKLVPTGNHNLIHRCSCTYAQVGRAVHSVKTNAVPLHAPPLVRYIYASAGLGKWSIPRTHNYICESPFPTTKHPPG